MNAPLPRDVIDEGQLVVARPVVPDPQPTLSPRTHRRRRRGQREADRAMHHSTDRWMVSYADFVTLLFAFFVVMYAMSSVNEGRYRVLSGALSTAFSTGDGTAGNGQTGKPGGPAVAPSDATQVLPPLPPLPPLPKVESKAVAVAPSSVAQPIDAPLPVDPVDLLERAELAQTAARVQHMTELATKVDEHLQALVRNGQVQVTRGARGIAIEINAAVLFDPARAELKAASFDSLRTLADVLQGFVEPLQIEGHSDDVPIATREYRSNWELSAARAASVGRFLMDQGIAPARIGIAGYAEFRPLVANASAETRARNRRVTLLVLSADDRKPKEGVASPDPASPKEAAAAVAAP